MADELAIALCLCNGSYVIYGALVQCSQCGTGSFVSTFHCTAFMHSSAALAQCLLGVIQGPMLFSCLGQSKSRKEPTSVAAHPDGEMQKS